MPNFATVPLESLLEHRAAQHSLQKDPKSGGEVPELPSVNEDGGFSSVGGNVVNDNNSDANDYYVNGDEDDEDDEGFVDMRSETMSVGSDDFLVGKQTELRCSVSAAQRDFFDANDDFSSDGSISVTPSYISRIESELHATRLNILDEIESRNCAEETLILMRSQWERIGDLISQSGLTFPSPPAASEHKMQLVDDSIDQFLQKVVVTRFVAEAFGKGQARAEAEEAYEKIIESKDHEILRLKDRLQYYETVNHELSQRKLVDVVRRQQERKKSRTRWIWRFMGFSVAIGASFVAYSYIPQTSEYLSSFRSGDLTDNSGVNHSDTIQR